MRVLAVIVVLFALAALDLTTNGGQWFWTVNAWVDDVLRTLGAD